MHSNIKNMQIEYIKTSQIHHLNIRTTPFETLFRLEGYLLAQLRFFRYAVMGILALALSSPVWFGVAAVLGLSGQTQLAIFFTLLMPGCILAALMLWLCLYFVILPDADVKNQLLFRIRHEIWRRGKVPFSFACDN